jgi:siroheme decarboxylase
MKLSAEDKKIIRQIQGDLPLSLTPFTPLAQRVGLEEKEFLRRIRGLMRHRLIRRFGAILRHQIAGFKGNAMVVWQVPEEKIHGVAQIITSYPAVSHCYLRPLQAQWPYNLYSMIHGKTDRDCRLLAKKLSRETGLKDYKILFSKRELKKSSMRYFEQT